MKNIISKLTDGLCKNPFRKNPFRISFLSVAVICCIVFSIVFYFIGYVNTREVKRRHNQKRAELLIQDWESQLQLMTDTVARIASDYDFHPLYFEGDVTKEKELLEKFKQFNNYLPLTNESFLYYGGSYIYRSTGTTLNLDLFLENSIEDPNERYLLMTELESLNENSGRKPFEVKVINNSEAIYALLCFRVNRAGRYSNAMCGYLIEKDAMRKRFEVVAGGSLGSLCLYLDDMLLYSNYDNICSPGEKDVLTATSVDEHYTLCYLPDKESHIQNGLFPYLLILILLDILFALFIANMYAERSYVPIRNMASKYKNFRMAEDCDDCNGNAIDEIKDTIDSIIKRNLDANAELVRKQNLLKEQLLYLLLNGRYPVDMECNLRTSEIHLPGPCYFVLSLSFEEEPGVNEEVLSKIRGELEQITNFWESVYVYTVYSRSPKRIYVICSMDSDEKKEELCENICDVAESFCYIPQIGIGNTYKTLTNLSTSWLESTDNLHYISENEKAGEHDIFVYDSTGLHKIIEALENGNEIAALHNLTGYIDGLKRSNLSLLMQQYVFADFIGEITKLGRKMRLELSRQNISMLISARNLSDFEECAGNTIRDFCVSVISRQEQMEQDEAKSIYEYINQHFDEYDMSLEKTAADLQVSIGEVRKAVMKYTGKTYKEYLIYLRIEYAKQLLQNGELTLAEVCNKIGYGSVSYFIKLFKETTGLTPSKYKGK